MSLQKQNTTLKSVLLALGVVVVAVVILYAAEKIPSIYPSWKALTAALGSLLIATVAFAVVWELFQKRLFRDELLDYFRLSENIQQSGVERIVYRFDEIDWKEYFENCTNFDFFASYARSWRGTNESRLRELAARSGAKVRIVLPDPNNGLLVRQLAVRFRKSDEEIQRFINDAIVDYRRIFTNKPCQFSLKLTDRPPTHAYYRFNERRISTLYNYKEEKGDVPVFILKQSGRLTNFFEHEFEYLHASGTSPQ